MLSREELLLMCGASLSFALGHSVQACIILFGGHDSNEQYVLPVHLVYSGYHPPLESRPVNWGYVAHEHCHILYKHSVRVHITV